MEGLISNHFTSEVSTAAEQNRTSQGGGTPKKWDTVGERLELSASFDLQGIFISPPGKWRVENQAKRWTILVGSCRNDTLF